jgi:hypothetical protein
MGLRGRRRLIGVSEAKRIRLKEESREVKRLPSWGVDGSSEKEVRTVKRG